MSEDNHVFGHMRLELVELTLKFFWQKILELCSAIGTRTKLGVVFSDTVGGTMLATLTILN